MLLELDMQMVRAFLKNDQLLTAAVDKARSAIEKVRNVPTRPIAHSKAES